MDCQKQLLIAMLLLLIPSLMSLFPATLWYSCHKEWMLAIRLSLSSTNNFVLDQFSCSGLLGEATLCSLLF